MSILIIGADRIKAIKPKLEQLGATRITHWSARNRNSNHAALSMVYGSFLKRYPLSGAKKQLDNIFAPTYRSRLVIICFTLLIIVRKKTEL
ncbi:MAG: hypothetical protein U9Q58_06275 [Pseudomonadota bacterium]|nr:hypothetical protein [Pseudomonadota bacterium]